MSFTKATTKITNYNIPGTKSSIQSTNLLLTSSGTPSLDYLLGGGLPCGSLFVIEEDVSHEYSRVLLKYFLAEGIVCNHHVFVASLDSDVNELVKELPESTLDKVNVATEEDTNHSLRIAWRYSNVERINPILKPSSQFGHYFDLSRKISPETISKSNIDCWLNPNEDIADIQNTIFHHLLRTISKRLKGDMFNPDANSDNSNILRIGIESIGSPSWTTHEIGNANSSHGRDLLKFIFCLRALLRSTYSVAFLTIPSHLYQEGEIDVVKRIQHNADFVIKLESFIGSEKGTNPLFKEYHGLVYVPKISAMNTLIPHVPLTLDLAFKLRRKKFIIEKLHLPPELQESTEREQDDLSNIGCSGPNKKNLDF